MKSAGRIFKLLLTVFLLACAIFTYTGYKKYAAAKSKLPVSQIEERLMEKENYTLYQDIAPLFIKAAVSVEDRRFFYHKGIDVIGVLRALVQDVRQKSLAEGGSTITQQLAKNIYFLGDNSPTRKIAEMFAAADIEKHYGKEKILEMYFNVIYYGSGYYCIYDAAEGYFNKKPSELTDGEATLLAGIPNAPSAYSFKNNPVLSYKRREKVLRALLRDGEITEETAQTIRGEGIDNTK